MRTVIVEVIDSTIGCFQGVIELKSTDIDTKSNEELTAIGVQLAAAPNSEGVPDQIFRPKVEAGRGLWQLNNLVLDINGEGCDVLV